MTQEPEGIDCQIVISDAGLEHRGPRLVAREAPALQMHAHYLKGTSARGRKSKIPAFTTRELHDALLGDALIAARSAAFLSGRCRAADEAADQRLVERLRAVYKAHADARVRTEAAMSLALRGVDRAAVTEALLALATPDTLAGEPWTAAEYLAQFGNAAGWPTMMRALASDVNTSYRNAAARSLLAFEGVRGQKIGQQVVDHLAALAALADDPDAAMRQIIPGLLVEAGHPEARSLIAARIAKETNASAKLLAEHALKKLDRQ